MAKKDKNLKPRVALPAYEERWCNALCLLGIIVAGFLAYANTFKSPFIFSDMINIVGNPSIRSLKTALSPPFGSGLGIRPVVNMTFAVNYALGGYNVSGYHAFNIIIHVLCAFALFGIVRRTILLEQMRHIGNRVAGLLALATSLIWVLHPIQTQAVTFLTQRCESLMGLFFLLTFYCAIRGFQAQASNAWYLSSFLFFLLGVGSKEVIVVVPVMVLLYEIIFMRRSLKEIISRSWPLYAGFASGLVILFFLVKSGAGAAYQDAGSEVPSLAQYWAMQAKVMLHYLKLIFWPVGFCFDYNWPVAEFKDTWVSLVVVTALFAGSVWACYRRQPIGFAGLWFFLILTPSSIVPLPDVAFEYRMYLPSAAVALLFVIAVYHAVLHIPSGAGNNRRISDGIQSKIFIIVCLVISGGLGILTFQRNEVYRTEERLWEDTIKKSPQNARAHLDLGHVLERSGSLQEAMNHYYRAITLKPDYVKAHINYGNGWLRLGKPEFAADQYRIALRLKPADAVANSGLGKALYAMGRVSESIKYFREVVYLMPNWPEGYSDLGLALSMAGQHQEAVPYLTKAINMRNDYFEAHVNLGLVYERMKRYEDACGQFAKALKIRSYDRAAQEGAQRVNRHIKQKQPAPE